MKIVYFLRSAPYDYLIEGFDLYDSFDLVARKKADPDINPTTIRIRIPNVSVFCAPDKRCFSTAKLICNEPKRLGLLSEIGYSMAEIMPKSEFFGIDGKPDVTKARSHFLKALINDRTTEKYSDILSRIDSLINILKATETESVVAVSHGFFMKFAEAYFRDSSIKGKPQKLRNYFDAKSVSYRFLEGFTLSLDQKESIIMHSLSFV